MAVIALTQSSNLQTLDIQADNIVEVTANGSGSDVSYYYQGAQSNTVTVTQSPTAIQALAPNIISVTDVSQKYAGCWHNSHNNLYVFSRLVPSWRETIG